MTTSVYLLVSHVMFKVLLTCHVIQCQSPVSDIILIVTIRHV